MPTKQNNAINPDTLDTPLIQLTRMRSPRIKQIKIEDRNGVIGGYSNINKGLMCVPSSQNAQSRIIRYHETLHIQHTPNHVVQKDLLDQGLEDARLHRYKSKASSIQFSQTRRDEVCVALRDLHSVVRTRQINSLCSMGVLRAMAILQSTSTHPNHDALLNRALLKLGKNAKCDFTAAIAALAESSGKHDKTWQAARKHVIHYFDKDFAPAPRAIVAPKPVESKSDPDVYSGSLIAPFDINNPDLKIREPLTVYVRRLDMGVNRVKLSMGKRREAPTKRGRKILGSRLAAASFRPNIRVFERSAQTGNSGTILIDASESMRLTEETLKKFLAEAPALTLAFYNAPADTSDYGNIYIYAANGFRAATFNQCALEMGCINGLPENPRAQFGWGNVIDYQAMVWLSRQPAPRYLLTDCGWTQWQFLCETAKDRFVRDKTFTLVEPQYASKKTSIEVMLEILDKKRRA